MKDPQPLEESTTHIDNPPEWFIRLHQRVAESYDNVVRLAHASTTRAAENLTTLRSHYEAVRREYVSMSGMLYSNVELTKRQIDALEARVSQDASAFSDEVWSHIAKFSKIQQDRELAIQRLKDIADHHHAALTVLQQEMHEQQERQGELGQWARQKDDQISELLQRAREGTISTQEQSYVDQLHSFARAAVKEAFAQERKKGSVDMNTVIGSLAKRAARTGSMEPTESPKNRGTLKKSHSSGSKRVTLDLSDEALRRDATRETVQRAERELAGMRSGDFMISGGSGGGLGGIPPPPPSDPSSSDSESDHENDSGDARSSRPTRRISTKPQTTEDRFITFLAKNLKTGPTVTMNKPEKFSGKDKSKFIAWWESVESYMDVHKRNFEDDSGRIGWVGSLYTDTALEWHQKRRRQIKKLGAMDSWSGYVTALTERFTDPARSQRDFKAMRELKYTDDISEYITKLQELNHSVGWSGVPFREHIKQTVPRKVIDLIYSQHGGVASTDEDFLQQIVQAGLIYETMQVDQSLQRSGKVDSTSTKEHSKSDRRKERSRSHSDQPSRKRKRNDGEDRKAKSPREKMWSSETKALAGVDKADKAKHTSERRDCIRCGRNGHTAIECYASRTESGRTLPKAPEKVSGTSRASTSAPEEGTEQPPRKKKVKIAGLMANPDPEPFPRIFELSDSDLSEF